jgi:hypothetical protein
MHRRHVVLGGAGILLAGRAFAQERGQGVTRVRGAAQINGQPAKPGMAVRPGDSVVTGANSEIVFVAGRDALLVRENSTLTLAQNGLRLVTGAVLGVFAQRQRKSLQTSTATIGIRGTAVYLEAERARTYVCTCYGETVLVPVGDPQVQESVRPTQRHQQPRHVHASGAPRMVAPAPMLNHTDAELELLQRLLP